jgi:hypothetical protein
MNLTVKWIAIITLFNVAASQATIGQMSPPAIRGVKPAYATPGETVKLTIQGSDLDRATALSFDDPRYRAVVESASRDQVVASFSVPKDVIPGPIHFRLVAPGGLSNAARIEVTRSVTTLIESEPNDGFRKPQVVRPPCTIEGNIRNGNDVDVFAVDVREGETLVAEAVAERAGSTLDALVTIFDPNGRELATVDDLFGHDAAVSARALKAGRYYVQIVDADGRKRDGMAEAKLQANRTYRLSVGTIALITSVDPPGLRRREATRLRLTGANVPRETILTVPAETSTGDFPFSIDGSNPINLRIGDTPEVREAEPDDRPEQAIAVTVPAAINGSFERKPGGDVDLYRLKAADGRAGDYAITVYAARIGSPADPVLAVLGDDARSLAEDDDKLGRDARIERKIEPGGLLIGVREFYGRGGERFLYRIEVEPLPKLRLIVDLGARTVPRSGRIALPIEAERRGYDGPLTILPGPLPPGVTGSTLTIPAAAKRGLLILTAEPGATIGTFPLRLVARDVPTPIEWTYLDRTASGPSSKPLPMPETGLVVAIAEPATLGVSIDPPDIQLTPGGEAAIKVRVDRRGIAAKGIVKVTLESAEGDLAGFEAVKVESIAADSSEHVFHLKAKADTVGRRFPIVARARFEATAKGRDVASNAVSVIVGDQAK